jgi:hypothetical protein
MWRSSPIFDLKNVLKRRNVEIDRFLFIEVTGNIAITCNTRHTFGNAFT